MRPAVVFIWAVLLADPARAMPLPDCANEIAIGHARVAQIEKDGTLVLGNGRNAVLEGIRLPGADSSKMPIAAEALQALKQLASHEPLVLTAVEPKRDRYDRL